MCLSIFWPEKWIFLVLGLMSLSNHRKLVAQNEMILISEIVIVGLITSVWSYLRNEFSSSNYSSMQTTTSFYLRIQDQTYAFYKSWSCYGAYGRTKFGVFLVKYPSWHLVSHKKSALTSVWHIKKSPLWRLGLDLRGKFLLSVTCQTKVVFIC